MQRNPSHFGSYSNGPSGSASSDATGFDNIGLTGGSSGRRMAWTVTIHTRTRSTLGTGDRPEYVGNRHGRPPPQRTPRPAREAQGGGAQRGVGVVASAPARARQDARPRARR